MVDFQRPLSLKNRVIFMNDVLRSFENLNLDKKLSAEWIKKTGLRLSFFEASQYSEKCIEMLIA